MKVLSFVCALAAMMALTGCVKVEQTLTLNKDGSGKYAISYGMSEQTVQQMEAMQKMQESMGEEGEEEDSNPFDFDADKIKKQFEDMKQDGITLVSVDSETKDGWKYMNVVIAFDNLIALTKTDFMSDASFSLTRDNDGNYIMEQRSQGMGDDEEMTPEMKQMMLQQMAPMMAGMRIAMNVVVPTEILESNASSIKGNEASWVFDVDKDPSFLVDSTKQNMRLVFAGQDLNYPDISITPDEEDGEMED